MEMEMELKKGPGFNARNSCGGHPPGVGEGKGRRARYIFPVTPASHTARHIATSPDAAIRHSQSVSQSVSQGSCGPKSTHASAEIPKLKNTHYH